MANRVARLTHTRHIVHKFIFFSRTSSQVQFIAHKKRRRLIYLDLCAVCTLQQRARIHETGINAIRSCIFRGMIDSDLSASPHLSPPSFLCANNPFVKTTSEFVNLF